MQLTGINMLSLDVKHRLSVPTRYREPLRQHCLGRLVMTVDPIEGCALLYPLPDWEVVAKHLSDLPSGKPKLRQIKRIMLSYAEDCALDNSGRLLLPRQPRERIGLEKDVAFLGQGNKFELWDKQTWDEQHDDWEELKRDALDDEDIQQLKY